MNTFLFKRIDNAPLIVFRIFLGILIFAEAVGALVLGWVNEIFVAPEFTFPLAGFEFLKPLPGIGMYVLFAGMALLGILISIGYWYRIAVLSFSIIWLYVYVLQTSSYNNHYYLLAIVCFIMCFLPAHAYASIDVKKNPALFQATMPQWILIVMIVQIAIVYFYAAAAKFYPDWLDATFTRRLFLPKSHYPIVGYLFDKSWFHYFIAYAGIGFDMLIVPFFLFKNTRMLALIASLIFHLFNAAIIQIGIFPFFALSLIVFFYPPETIRRTFFKNKKPQHENNESYQFKGEGIFKYIFIPHLLLQMLLPLRHHFIEGNVFWTDEAHKHSWRMMLRSRSGKIKFKVVNKNNGEESDYPVYQKVSMKQRKTVSISPFAIQQMAKHIGQEYKAKGEDVAVYAESYLGVNGRPMLLFIDSTVDLTKVKYTIFGHNDWVLTYPDSIIFSKK